MVSLYELSVENFARVLNATIGFMQKSQTHAQSIGQDINQLVDQRLTEDMLPFSFQINSVRHHSLHAAQGLLNESFSPPEPLPSCDFSGLIDVLNIAHDQLMNISPEEIQAKAGGQVIFTMGSTVIPFTSENFVMSFSLPNLYFHATTAYDLLRMNGAPLGKKDFLGKMNIHKPHQ